MKTVSIGFQREDGDFAVLATLNNNDGDMTDDAFHALVRTVHISMVKFNAYVVVLERQDAPDYVSI
jgi:hypothetical protein